MPNGDAAFAAGLPVADGDADARLGYDAINALADALARVITDSWKQGVNTTKGISTTGDINALGRVVSNIIRSNGELRGRDGFIDFNLNVGGEVTCSSVKANGDVAVGNVSLVDHSVKIADLLLRVKALEAK